MKKGILFVALAIMLLTSCNKYYNHVVRGVLYTDSSKTSPVAGGVLKFTLPDELTYMDGGYANTPLGSSMSDSLGRWGFSFNHLQQDDRIKSDPVRILITYNDDTLYLGDADITDTLELYPL